VDELGLGLQAHGMPGRLVVFDGTDGSGKTTLVRAAVSCAQRLGHRVVEVDLLDDFVRFSSPFRRYATDAYNSRSSVDMLALSVLCAGSRLGNARLRVLPALAAGDWVFCDRYIFTTWAEYAALSRPGDEWERLRSILQLFPRPDLAILPHASARTCIARVVSRADEADKVMEEPRIQHLIETYRAVGRANGFAEVSTESRSPEECERAVEAIVREFASGATGIPAGDDEALRSG
jgi:dTMP kinase